MGPGDGVEPDKVGVVHEVRTGESLWRIGRAYQVDAAAIAIANQLEDASKIRVGQKLFIPGAASVREVPAGLPAPAEGSLRREGPARFEWPLEGVLYARFGPRGETRHDGIDIAAPLGTLVRSAGEGKVLFSGDHKGYGLIVILEHEDGLLTLYAHNHENLVREGDRIRGGSPVARVGESGRTSGPHLHFEVRQRGAPKDPLDYLPTLK
jgi:murein DD-endopeptidase MepM/ murein hydrolase activator NlpD